jgi:membrane protease YdiL (CAAX protease family)
MTLTKDSSLFAVGGLLVLVVIRAGVPAVAATGLDPFIAWMLLAAPFVFTPILGLGWLVLRSEGQSFSKPALVDRLRLHRPTGRDWLWTAAGIVAIGAASAAMMALCNRLGLDIDPFHRTPRPWSSAWVVALWLVYWPLNIWGEELVWRGVLLPRMESALGARAWLANALLWAAFHTGFGIGNILVVSPTLVLVPLLAQRRRSTWVAVALHAGLSLPGMVGIALGRL